MTSSRIVRGTKARIFLYLCAALIITGIIACYNNTLSQLDDARKSSELCLQQEEGLSVQLQVVTDYKQRLEKSLKTEQAERQQAKQEFETKLKEERAKNEKSNSETGLRFNSLQQHFNLLQTQHDDFKEECSKSQSKQMNEINDLQAKLKEVQEELKKVESAKENLKTQYLQTQIDMENLQKQLKTNSNNEANNESHVNHLTKVNHELRRELDTLKTAQQGLIRSQATSFREPTRTPALNDLSSLQCCQISQTSDSSVSFSNNERCGTLEAPRLSPESSSPRDSANFSKQVKINSNEYEIKRKVAAADQPLLQDQQVLAAPSSNNVLNGPTKSTTASSLKSSQGSLNGARPLLIPTVTLKTDKKRAMNEPLPYMRKLPEGVVPLRETIEKKTDDAPNEPAFNNRYRNKIDNEAKKGDDVDRENGAHEIFDQPARNGAYDALGFGDLNDPIKNAEKQNYHKQHIDALGVGDKDGNKIYDGAADYKENQNDIQMEENDPEEDDDADEYGDHLARQKDPAVRN